MFGYHFKYLKIDLSRDSSEFVSISESVLRKFIGGSGLGTCLLLHCGADKFDAFAPESSIAFVFSPLVSSPLTTSAKFAVVCKSPLTNRLNDSLASSGFAIAGKKSGCDAIVISGRTEKPSVLIIDNGKVSIESANEFWGLEISESEARLKQKFGSKFRFAVIGPAGENQVRFATISHDGRHAGRGGSGAVLGSKNIKAIGVCGDQTVEWAQPEKLFDYAKELSKKSFGKATAKYRELGTASNLLAFNRLNCLPTRNFQSGSFENAEAIAPETISQAVSKTRSSCAACTIGCEHIYGIANSDNGSQTKVRLEYENLFALGPLCGIDDPQIVLMASKRCDELGLDTISAGGTISFAMECYEKGLIENPKIKFGDGQGLLKLLEQIAFRKDAGNLLANGSRHAASRIGQNSIDFAPQVKGLEMPGYEPRTLQNMALGFAVNSRGADHNRSGAYEVDFAEGAARKNLDPEKVTLAIETENKAALMDSLIFCKFLRGVFDDFFAESAAVLGLVTGWETTANELLETSNRIVAAKKLFNIRSGWTPAEDTLPKRFLNQKLTDDPSATLSESQLNAAVAAYNLSRGWNEDGFLDKACLAKLQLLELAN